MFKIKTSLDINGVGWGLRFEHGVAFTEREDLARRLKSLGYEVVDLGKAPAKQPAATTLAPEASQEQPTSDSNAPEAPADNSITDAAPEKLKCPICGKECGSQAVLTRHTNKEHS